MCWKEEWAYAISNLSLAIAHIENARKKMAVRRARAKRWRQKWSKSGHAGPKGLLEIDGIIEKYDDAEQLCISLIEAFASHQYNLQHMIEKYGFNRKPSGSVRVRKILKDMSGKEAES